MSKKKYVTARELLKQLAGAGKLPLAKYMQLDLALQESDLAGVDMTGIRRTMIDAMARFAYVLAWDTDNNYRLEDLREHKRLGTKPSARAKRAVHIPGGSQIEDYVPERTPAGARTFARELAQKYEDENGVPFEALFILAMIADPSVGTDDAESFAQDLVFMSSESGVSWFDSHEEFELEIPHDSYYI